jgi:hypothetical protein
VFFKFQGALYRQVEGLPMGSPISPIIANIFMEEFEKNVLQTFPDGPSVWLRYVDDTFVIIKREMKDLFLNHINTQYRTIKFTLDEGSDSGELAFLDCLVQRNADGGFTTKVYRKPTHTNRYLNYDSSHSYDVKVGIAKSLLTRANRLSSNQEEVKKEQLAIIEGLKSNGYPNTLLKRMIKKVNEEVNQPQLETNGNQLNPSEWKKSVVIPYEKNTSEAIRRVLNKIGIRVTFSAPFTIKNKLVHLKDKQNPKDTGGVVYKLQCSSCPISYIGETSRAVSVRCNEHKKLSQKTIQSQRDGLNLEASSAIAAHVQTTGHSVNFDEPQIILRNQKFANQRKIAEQLIIASTPDNCNRMDSTQLSHVWSRILPRR